ncbi:hypothetical protein HDK77DRAFT_381681 [Phyllosticta capitalensis]
MRACLRALAIVTAAAAVAVPKPEPQNDQPLVLELGNNAHLVSPATVPVTDTTILDAKDARATFSVPCQGCLGGDDDESLVFDLQVFPSAQPCGQSNITLNGQPLTQHWENVHAEGAGLIAAHHEPQRQLNLTWETLCLFDTLPESDESSAAADDVAQLLTVKVHDIDDKPVGGCKGFTASFKQFAQKVDLLRLATKPIRSASGDVEDWRNPPAALRLVPVDFDHFPEGFYHQGPSIEQELNLLQDLEAEEKELHHRIGLQKERIKALIKDNAHGFPGDASKCDNISCILKSFFHKAHGAIRIIYHDIHRGRPDHGPHREPGPPGMKFPPPPGPPPPPYGNGPPPPPPPFGGPPPFGPHHGPHHGPPRIVHILMTLASISGLAFVFKFIKKHCLSLRKRTELRAACEERRTAREYRRLARRHAWNKWWSGRNGDWERRGDYEEKRALILEQEDRLEEAMQDEIRQLQTAQELAHDIVRAEEGRFMPGPSNCRGCAHAAHHHHVPHMAQYPHGGMYPGAPPPAPHVHVHPTAMSQTTSLPSYKSELSSVVDTDDAPPAYEEDADSSDIVVDGFRPYNPSVTTTAYTPESSIPDVSPRPSAETLRRPAGGLGNDADGDGDPDGEELDEEREKPTEPASVLGRDRKN